MGSLFPLEELAAVVAGRLPPDAVPAERWPALAGLAVRHGMGPLLLHRVDEAGMSLPAASAASLKQSARQSAAHYAALEIAQAEIEAVLQAAGIDTVWIKGVVLAQTLYPRPDLRPMSDLDVLIPQARRADALEAVRALGYTYRPDDPHLFAPGDPLVLKRSQHDQLMGGPARAVILELHHHLLSVDESILSPDGLAWFWSQTQPYRAARGQFHTLTPTASLLYLCAHAELQHAETYVQRSYDLHLLICADPPDWPLAVEQAAALRWTYPVERALSTCAALFETPLPPGLVEQLRAHRPADEDTARVDRLRGQGARWFQVRRRLVQLPPADRLAMAARVAVPPQDYMRRRYAVAAGRPVWPFYIVRWLDQIREVLRALFSGRGRPR